MKNKYTFLEDCVEIFVERRSGEIHSFFIDHEDFEKVAENYPNSWTIAKRRNNHYIVGQYKGEHFYLHRFLMDAPKNMLVDHKNHNTLDNKRDNLRIVTITENNRNLKGATKRSQTGVRGVYKWRNTGRYIASVGDSGEKVHVGYFDSLKDAELAVEKARIEYGYSQNN